ncbi:uncharacterized protein cubi_00765 [Cryptosporidium ubiquitum]|uniref:Enhancer of rudimentary homolog n=1 Tax=Cryptosporidium ubiquitum TaxID=857276 RepID=A0A1J4MD19_9CRYT|nr:uncharacterized protein cubi_00765 [Cryptosporidium ubiquitum]OII71387.1 hypothetical protein cubi_00765 [Cryptosporidium ubiquitum]
MAQNQGLHTLLLIQYSNNISTRSYMDYDSVSQAVDGVCQIYEQSIKCAFSNLKEVTYSIEDLVKYINSLYDICMLTRDGSNRRYIPHDRKWIIDQIYLKMKRRAAN